MADSFQTFRGSLMRLSRRRVCSPGLTSSQYFSSKIPSSTMAFSNPGTSSRNRSVSPGLQKPITRSTPALLYQLRSKITTSPAAGKCGMYRCTYICDFSRSVGVSRAMTRNTRGLTRSVMRLIVPPFPAVSRPSKTMQILAPDALTHSCMATSSPCRSLISRSYSLRFIFAGGPASAPRPAAADDACTCFRLCFCSFFFFLAMSLTSDGCSVVGVMSQESSSGFGVTPGTRPAAQPLRVGPGDTQAQLDPTRQGLGQHDPGGGLEFAAQRVGGTGCLQSQGPPGLATGADLGEFHRTPRLLARPRCARPGRPA